MMLVEGGPAVWRRGTTDTERGRTFFQDRKRRGLRIHFWWPAMGAWADCAVEECLPMHATSPYWSVVAPDPRHEAPL